MKKIIYYTFISLFFSYGCKDKKNTLIPINNKEQTSKNIISSNNTTEDILSSPNNVILNFSYCDLVKNKGFTEIKPNRYDIPNIDSLSFGFKIKKDTLKFSYQFSSTEKSKQDRNVIFNNSKYLFKRITFKDSTVFKFNGFMCDYKNASFYVNKKLILIKSRPEEWSGNINQFKFYQLIDKDKNTCYEFFLNEKVKCKFKH